MNKLFTTLCLTGALAMAAWAEDGTETKKKHSGQPPTAEQKALRKEILEKYDTNKDGKLDKDERAKISAQDKAKLEKAGLGHKQKGKAKKDAETK